MYLDGVLRGIRHAHHAGRIGDAEPGAVVQAAAGKIRQRLLPEPGNHPRFNFRRFQVLRTVAETVVFANRRDRLFAGREMQSLSQEHDPCAVLPAQG